MKLALSFLLVAVGAAAAQQCNCGSPAPVNIQMSCGGAPVASQPAPPPPPPAACPAPQPPPAHTFEPEQPVSTTQPSYDDWTTTHDYYHDHDHGNTGDSELDYTAEEICHFDSNGFPTTSPPGGFPCGFMVKDFDNNGRLSPNIPWQVPHPSFDWDHEFESLLNTTHMHGGNWRGHPLPEKGTALYNMLMCWPSNSLTNCFEFSAACSIHYVEHEKFQVNCDDEKYPNTEAPIYNK